MSEGEVVTGPVDYLIVEWPAEKTPTGEAFPFLVDLVDRGLIRVLDLSFIHKDHDGSVKEIDIADFDGDGELGLFVGARSGLLDDEDHVEAGEALVNGASAALLVYENVWSAPFANALRNSGAQLVARGPVPIDAIVATLDELDDAQA